MEDTFYDEPELKPCPFCGGKAELSEADEEGEDAYSVMCTRCLATSPVRFSIKEDAEPLLIDAWNSRATDTELREIKEEREQLYAAVNDGTRLYNGVVRENWRLREALQKMKAWVEHWGKDADANLACTPSSLAIAMDELSGALMAAPPAVPNITITAAMVHEASLHAWQSGECDMRAGLEAVAPMISDMMRCVVRDAA